MNKFWIDKKYKKILLNICLTILTVAYIYIYKEPTFFKKNIFISSRILYVYILLTFNCFIFFIWNVIINIIYKIKSKDEMVIKFLKHFFAYLIIMLVVFVLIYPGYWEVDEAFIINELEYYVMDTWHGIFTEIFHAMSLLMFGQPVTIIVTQIVLISMIFSYIQTKVEKIYDKKIYNLILYFVFCLPPILVYNLCAMRLCFYSYMVLLLISILTFNKIEKTELSLKNIINIMILTFICSVWRTEGLIFVLVVPIFLKLIYKEKFTIKYMGSFVLISVILIICYNCSIKKDVDPKYQLVATINPLSMMMTDSNFRADEETIESLQKVMNIELFEEHHSSFWTPAYYNAELFKENFAQYKNEFLLAFVKVVINNFDLFLKYRLETYSLQSTLCYKIQYDYESEFMRVWTNKEINNYQVAEFIEKYQLRPWNVDVKDFVESMLTGGWYKEKYSFIAIRGVFWNMNFPIIILLIVAIASLVKKDWFSFGVVCMYFIMFGIVFATQPATTFRYLLPEYIGGFFYSCIYFFNILDKGKAH